MITGQVPLWGLHWNLNKFHHHLIPSDSCDPNPCINDGSCSVTSDGSFECSCTGNWAGRTCSECGIERCEECSTVTGVCTKCREGFLFSQEGCSEWCIYIYCLLIMLLSEQNIKYCLSFFIILWLYYNMCWCMIIVCKIITLLSEQSIKYCHSVSINLIICVSQQLCAEVSPFQSHRLPSRADTSWGLMCTLWVRYVVFIDMIVYAHCHLCLSSKAFTLQTTYTSCLCFL